MGVVLLELGEVEAADEDEEDEVAAEGRGVHAEGVDHEEADEGGGHAVDAVVEELAHGRAAVESAGVLAVDRVEGHVGERRKAAVDEDRLDEALQVKQVRYNEHHGAAEHDYKADEGDHVGRHARGEEGGGLVPEAVEEVVEGGVLGALVLVVLEVGDGVVG